MANMSQPPTAPSPQSSSLLDEARGRLYTSGRAYLDDLAQSSAQRASSPTSGSPQSPQFPGFLKELERVANDAVTYAANGDVGEAHKRRAWLDQKLADPTVQQAMTDVASAGIEGYSQRADRFASGMWTREIVQATRVGVPLSESALKTKHGPMLGSAMHRVQNGLGTPADERMLHAVGEEATFAAKPILQRDPATGRSVEVGQQPDTELGLEVVRATDSMATGTFGLPPSDPSFGSLTQASRGTMRLVYAIARPGEAPALSAALTAKVMSFTGVDAKPEQKLAEWNGMEPVLHGLAGEIQKDPTKQAMVNEYLNKLPTNLPRDQFLRDVVQGFTKFAEYKKMDALVKKNERFFSGETVVKDWETGEAMDASDPALKYRGAVSDDDLVKLSLGQDDPRVTSVMENRIELGKRIMKRDAEVGQVAGGVSRFPDKDGRPQAATIPEQIIARRFQATSQAWATADATGNEDLKRAILQSGFAGTKDDLTRALGAKVMGEFTDDQLMVVIRHHLDFDAVQGSTEAVVNAAKSIPSLDELQASVKAKLVDPKTSQADLRELARADGVLGEVRALASTGRVGLSRNEIAEYDRHRSLAPASVAAEEDQIEMEKGRMLSTATKRLFSSEFLSNGVLNIASRDSVIGPSKGTTRAARNAIFSDTGLDALIPDKKTQDRIVMALQGATAEQAAVVLNDVLNTVAQPGIVKPRGLLSAITSAPGSVASDIASLRGRAAIAIVGPAGVLAGLGAKVASLEGKLELVDPGHRASFVAPESLLLALQARAGIPEAREAMMRLPAAGREQKQSEETTQTYDAVMRRLPPESKKLLDRLVPGVIPTKEGMLQMSIDSAYASGDWKKMEQAFRLSLDSMRFSEEQRKNTMDELAKHNEALRKATEAQDKTSYGVAALAIEGLTKLKVPPMSAAVPVAATTTPVAPGVPEAGNGETLNGR